MGLRKKHASKKKPAVDFGAALARARQEADHIFKQASQDEIQSLTTARFIGSPPNPTAGDDLKVVSPRSKAAAWAWYQRGGGNAGVTPEEVRNKALVVVKRSSRFKAEALRVNGSYTADDTIIKAEQKWDPNKSLFDSFELLCVAKELDKALLQQQLPCPPSSPSKTFQLDVPSGKGSPRSLLVSLSCSSPSLLRRMSAAKLSRFIPAHVRCISEDDVATSSALSKTKSGGSSVSTASSQSGSRNMLKRGMSVGSSTFGRISKAMHLFSNAPPSNNPPSLQDEVDEGDSSPYHHTHEHFHHHQHHHHHHVTA